MIDWRIELNVTLGFLYLFPLVLLGTTLNWPSVIAVAVGCTLLSDRLDPFSGEAEMARGLRDFPDTGHHRIVVSIRDQGLSPRNGKSRAFAKRRRRPARGRRTVGVSGREQSGCGIDHDRRWRDPAGKSRRAPAAGSYRRICCRGAELRAMFRRLGSIPSIGDTAQDLPHGDADAGPARKWRDFSCRRVFFHLQHAGGTSTGCASHRRLGAFPRTRGSQPAATVSGLANSGGGRFA